jgi:hypothetical protein
MGRTTRSADRGRTIGQKSAFRHPEIRTGATRSCPSPTHTRTRGEKRQETPHRLLGHGWQQKDPASVEARFSQFLPIIALVVGGAAHVSVAAEDWEQDWTVVTMARDGSWGVGIDRHMAAANAAAIRECRAMSSGGSDCGAELAAIRGGWIVGLRCDDYRILATGRDLEDAEVTALNREIDLKQIYLTDLPACRRVLTVDPRGAVTTASPRFSGRS